MDERTLDGLMERMGRLERQNRLMKRLGGVVLAVIALAMIVGANINDDFITCKMLTVTGPKGEPRIKLVAGNADQFSGRVTIQMLDPQGQLAAEMYWEPNGRTGRFAVYRNDGSGQIFRSMP